MSCPKISYLFILRCTDITRQLLRLSSISSITIYIVIVTKINEVFFKYMCRQVVSQSMFSQSMQNVYFSKACSGGLPTMVVARRKLESNWDEGACSPVVSLYNWLVCLDRFIVTNTLSDNVMRPIKIYSH